MRISCFVVYASGLTVVVDRKFDVESWVKRID